MAEKRTPAAEKAAGTRGQRSALSGAGPVITGRIPDIVPGPKDIPGA
jgi:hypothetical protein